MTEIYLARNRDQRHVVVKAVMVCNLEQSVIAHITLSGLFHFIWDLLHVSAFRDHYQGTTWSIGVRNSGQETLTVPVTAVLILLPNTVVSFQIFGVRRFYLGGIFYVLLAVRHVMLPGKWPTWRRILFYVFIFIFNSVHVSSTSCSSSGETNCVNTNSDKCRCLCRVQSDLHTTRPPTATRGCIDTICLSWWWARCARNMYRVKNIN